MKKILIVNGPNLNLLGKREPEIYGAQSFDDYLNLLRKKYEGRLQIDYFQSNSEGELVTKLQDAGFSAIDGIVLNAGAYTHTSLAMADAISAVKVPVVEVHISNVFRREEFRHHSYLSPVCAGTIVGFGLKSYDLALEAFL
ncbi:MAG: type II 3-dehydroquinate dehydratase [Bacteroidales bacterium]|jgi:3-dehydroquinate dehydratase-2|nr:type II 3-dehydroquinate dehydratase [Bacteroidales bacterium]MBR6310293.1 type II 3-dehydroquinate dehydratase [Paludibacteraceae bacterium]MDD6357719.1 type II 3-dehydroquinate dehydratase [Bacteroidales bacterium]